MKDKRFQAAFSTVELSEKDKERLLTAISDRAVDEETGISGRRTTTRRLAIVATAMACLALGVMLFARTGDRSAEPLPPDERPTIMEAAGSDGEYITYYSNIVLDPDVAAAYSLPATLDIAMAEPMRLSDEAVGQLLTNLENAGWSGIRRADLESHPALLFMSQPGMDDIDDDKEGVPFAATEEHRELGRKFISDSGLVEMLRAECNLELSTEPTDDTFATIFRACYDGFPTDSYVRLHFRRDGTLGEMKMYMEEFEIVVTATAVVPPEQAAKGAFAFSESGSGDVSDERLTVKDVEIVYHAGIPFWRFACEGEAGGELVAIRPAVESDVIESDIGLSTAYARMLEDGIW